MPVSYATREDVYRQGVPRGALVSRGRVVASVDITSDTLELEGHGLEAGSEVQFRAGENGALPAPLSTSAVYYALPVSGSDSLLQLETAPGAGAINLTSSGAPPVLLVVPLGPSVDALLDAYSRWVDSKLVGHHVPLASPFPSLVTHVVAVKTAAQLARAVGLGSQAEMLFASEEKAERDFLGSLGRGTTLRDAAATGPANRAQYAVAGSALDSARDVLP